MQKKQQLFVKRLLTIIAKKTIWDAPPKIMNEVAKVSKILKPSSTPIAPNIIPKGTTGINKGKIFAEPLRAISNFLFI